MRKRKVFNPKRRLCTDAQLNGKRHLFEDLAKRARYSGNPEHKRNPGDFGLDPPGSPRPGKTLCDVLEIYTRAAAVALLRAGLRKERLASRSVTDGRKTCGPRDCRW